MPATRKPSSARERIHLWWDLFIIVLVIANLALLLFDSLFLIPPLNTAFEAVTPGLHAAYEQNIHANFLSIDLAFVAVFLLDVLAGWAVAIAERRYHRWFFYPFVHWYDVLGCIPLSGFRLLRVLRVVSLLFRLQRLELIDVRQWYVYRVAAKYLDILLEELTDRISLRMLDNVQQQLRDSDDLSSSVIERVVEPRKQALIQEISLRLETMAGDIYTQNRDDTLRYVRGLVSRTLAESPELQRVSRLPMGSQLTKGLESSLSDLACHLVDEALVGLRSKEFSALVGHLAESGFDAWSRTDPRTEQITEQVLIDMLDLLKERIAVKSWQKKYQ
ncbi:ion transporter [Cobetia amphilecti]|uniref:ion transporter n=1 Tax=Cobetia amphilecti TaxID=1055104 RepID=UPI003298D302